MCFIGKIYSSERLILKFNVEAYVSLLFLNVVNGVQKTLTVSNYNRNLPLNRFQWCLSC